MQLLSVNFHYIRNQKPDKGIFPRSLTEFAHQIEELGRHYEFIGQSELIRILKSKIYPNKNYCMITFDDNLREQMDAFEYLRNNSIPAMFFSTTLPYLEKRVHDVHKSHHILKTYSDEELARILEAEFDFADVRFDDKLFEKSYRYDNPERKRIKLFLNHKLSEAERHNFIDRLFMQSVGSKEAFIRDFYMSEEDLTLLAEMDMLGTHTHSHLPLAILDDSHIEREMKTSSQCLTDITGKPIRGVSYPYGSLAAVNDVVARVAERVGYDYGLTMFRGINCNEDFSSRFLLKRVDTNDAPGGSLQSQAYLPSAAI